MAVIWSIASIVVQYLYTDQHFDSPFFLTYIGTSLFILLLISHTTWERRHSLCCCCPYDPDKQHVIPWRTSNTYQQVPSAPIRVLTSPESVSLEHVQIDCAETEPTSLDDDEDDIYTNHQITSSDISACWSHVDHFKVACKIAPVWFIANWAYNCSLAYTSITSSTVLASTGSLFTFIFAVISRDESYTTLKLVGVLLGVTGSLLTGLHDAAHHTNTTSDNGSMMANGYNETITTNGALLCVAGPSGTPLHVDISQPDAFESHAIWGDALGLVSAVGYGAYAVMIRIYCPHHEDCSETGGKQTMSMQLLLGYIGLVNAVSLSPIALYILLFQNTATSIGLTWIVFGYLVAKGMMDNVLSDYLWARAVVLTSATVATVGLGLTIPLAFVSDLVMGHGNILDATSIMGAIAVLAGFILVNVGEGTKEEEDSAANTTRDNDEVMTSSAPECLESEIRRGTVIITNHVFLSKLIFILTHSLLFGTRFSTGGITRKSSILVVQAWHLKFPLLPDRVVENHIYHTVCHIRSSGRRSWTKQAWARFRFQIILCHGSINQVTRSYDTPLEVSFCTEIVYILSRLFIIGMRRNGITKCPEHSTFQGWSLVILAIGIRHSVGSHENEFGRWFLGRDGTGKSLGSIRH